MQSHQARPVKVDLVDDPQVNLDLETTFEEKMVHGPYAIYKAFRLVPDFNRNPNIFTRFIKIVDKCFPMSNPQVVSYPICVSLTLLRAHALSILMALINNISFDQRDDTTLYNDLLLATEGNKSP